MRASTVFWFLVTVAVLGYTAAFVDTHVDHVQHAKLDAWRDSPEGERQLRCQLRPLTNSVAPLNAQQPPCPKAELARLDALQAARTEVTLADLLTTP